jgi:hypothetical protein
MDGAGLQETLQSAKNRVLWELRSRLRWSRSGYQESGAENVALDGEALALEKRYELVRYKNYLSEDVYRKNLWTLRAFEKLLLPHLRGGHLPLEILEPGCQDFARLPALRAFFGKQGVRPRFTGLELDPYPVLHDFHSRWDKAKYYLNLDSSADRYLAADFFRWSEAADLICCFYPFVSAHPALAWGLPARFGDPKPWIDGFLRNLRPDGLLLLVHQGEWEEEDFDEARNTIPGLRLLQRENIDAKYYPLPFPACASVYRRDP